MTKRPFHSLSRVRSPAQSLPEVTRALCIGVLCGWALLAHGAPGAEQAADLHAALQAQTSHQKAGQEVHERLGHRDRGEESAAFQLADVVEAHDIAAQRREGEPGDAKGKVDEKQ